MLFYWVESGVTEQDVLDTIAKMNISYQVLLEKNITLRNIIDSTMSSSVENTFESISRYILNHIGK